MSVEFEEAYLEWLYSQVASLKIKNPSRTYWNLFRKLFSTEFIFFIPNDDNRADDGKELRLTFMDVSELPEPDPDWLDLECSVLEMLIALSNRLAFETDSKAKDWFWQLLENIQLENCSDRNTWSIDMVDNILSHLNNRTYQLNGRGGLFPLRHPLKDQRKVELWYQMSAYLLENN